MTPLDTLLAALDRDPKDQVAWFALADSLEESGESDRAELVRLTRGPRGPAATEGRIAALLVAGVRPCVPEFTDPLGMRFVLVPAGRFVMGSAHERADDDETPHDIRITSPFWFGRTPVTQDEFRRVVGDNPSTFRDLADSDRHPVEMVSWDDATAFCARINDDDRMSVRGYRLPSEAEWEYACRAGTVTEFHLGDELSESHANYNRGPRQTTPVGSYPPNAWGLYDMHGNVWEWCHDWYDRHYYVNSPAFNPSGPTTGTGRVQRGGSWREDASGCRSAFRIRNAPDTSNHAYGFRVVLRWPITA